MAGRVGDAERLAREAYELGRRAQARDAETIHAAQTLILRRREDALQDYVSTIERYVTENPALVAWRAILPMAHLMGGNTQAGVAAVPRAGARTSSPRSRATCSGSRRSRCSARRAR